MEERAASGAPGRLAAGRWCLAALAVSAALEAWVDIARPTCVGPGWGPAVAWAVTEHPGRCAVGLCLAAWALWNPKGPPSGTASRHSPEQDRASAAATDPGEGRSIGL